MAARPLRLEGAAEVDMHLMPCIIEHSGEAQVSAYFKPQPTGGLHVLPPLLQLGWEVVRGGYSVL